MEKVKNICCLLVIHIFACIGTLIVFSSKRLQYEPNMENLPFLVLFLLLIIGNILLYGQLLVLPIMYNRLEKSDKFRLVAEFIAKIKNQRTALKLTEIVIGIFSCWTINMLWVRNRISVQLLKYMILSYVVLLIYWLIENFLLRYTDNTKTILKNVICWVFIHILANAGNLVVMLLGMLVVTAKFESCSDLSFWISVLTVCLLSFGRLFVLPVACKILEKSKTFELVAGYFESLKQSTTCKIIILIFAYFTYWDIGFQWFQAGPFVQLLESVFLGAVGSYLVLYVYWFIEDKWKKRKSLQVK